MQLRRFDDPAEFYAHALSFLMACEAEHCLILGILTTLMKTDMYQYPPYLACVEHDGQVIAVALRTPPHNLVLSQTNVVDALKLFVADVHNLYSELPGVVGPKLVSGQFAQIWQNVAGQPSRLNMQERLYQLVHVHPIEGVSGQNCCPTEADREVLVEWFMEFSAEALESMPREDAERQVNIRLTSDPSLRGLRLWVDDGKPVSFAGYGGPTPNGIRIGPVYTPPEFRGQGYASACVAALSQEMLDGGRKFCALHTDLSNPTSNHIYQNIGYEPVMDVDEYRFEQQPVSMRSE